MLGAQGCAGIQTPLVSQLSSDALASWTVECIQATPDGVWAAVDDVLMQRLPDSVFNALTTDFVTLIPAAAWTVVSAQQFAALPLTSLNGFIQDSSFWVVDKVNLSSSAFSERPVFFFFLQESRRCPTRLSPL
jgi:hypothetical protein